MFYMIMNFQFDQTVTESFMIEDLKNPVFDSIK